MPLFNPIPDEIDISENEEVQTPEGQELPEEVVIEDQADQEEETPQEETEDIVEQEETETEEPEQQQEPDESSLTSEPEAQAETEVQEPVELSDDSVFAYLSEKLGREVTSLEDLTPQEQAEDPLAGDEELQAIAEWKQKTGRPVSDWFKYQKDYSSMDPQDVVREYLQHKYPDFTPEEIQLEMEEFTPDEDIDTDTEIARKNLKLKKMAITAREELGKYKSTFNEPLQPNLTKEQQEAINFYQQYQQQSEKSQEIAKQYQEGITSEASKIKSLPLQLEDDFSIELKLSDQEARSLKDVVLKTPHWFNEDGSYNHSAIVRDAAKFTNFDKAVKLAYEQGLAKGREEDDAEGRNVNFNDARKVNDQSTKEEIVIEGADDMYVQRPLRFGRRR